MIQDRIAVVRGQRVMTSGALAELYGVPAKALLQAVKRNRSRFPTDFMFQLSPDEWSRLRSQIVTLDRTRSLAGRGQHAKYLPYAFTEHGVAMLSSVLKSRRAVAVNIEIVRTFVRLRQWFASNRDLARKVAELEKRYDGHFRTVFEALNELIAPPATPQRRALGFRAPTGVTPETGSAAESSRRDRRRR